MELYWGRLIKKDKFYFVKYNKLDMAFSVHYLFYFFGSYLVGLKVYK